MLSTSVLFFPIGLGSLGLIQVPQCSTQPKLSGSPHSPLHSSHTPPPDLPPQTYTRLGAAHSAPHVSASCPVFPSSADATSLNGCLWFTSLSREGASDQNAQHHRRLARAIDVVNDSMHSFCPRMCITRLRSVTAVEARYHHGDYKLYTRY